MARKKNEFFISESHEKNNLRLECTVGVMRRHIHKSRQVFGGLVAFLTVCKHVAFSLLVFHLFARVVQMTVGVRHDEGVAAV